MLLTASPTTGMMHEEYVLEARMYFSGVELLCVVCLDFAQLSRARCIEAC